MKPKGQPSERNQKIFNQALQAGFSQGVFQSLATQEGLTRERIRAIVKQVSEYNKENGGETRPAKPAVSVEMPTWQTTEDQCEQFRQLCDINGWSLAYGVREAVKEYLSNHPTNR